MRTTWWLPTAFVVACDLGTVPIGADAGPPRDAGPCEAAATPILGHHNPNTSCISAGCHADASGGIFTVAGTLSATAAGGAPVPGATVIVTGADAVEHRLVTGDNGNFYTGVQIAFPATVRVSKCPDTAVMSQPVNVADGNCTACHAPGGAGGGRLHLP
ncbi:MAG: hypothetical protein R2939_07745 [Kofleriaceae bacterium]